jgi:metal-dependent hydrolase (beta-lactamase superfamily II)
MFTPLSRRFQPVSDGKINLGYCTGEQAIEKFRKSWGKDFVDAGCGVVIKIPN